jgi:hypothetical protein
VLRGDLETGAQTPARVYGADFVLQFDRVTREDLDADGRIAQNLDALDHEPPRHAARQR